MERMVKHPSPSHTHTVPVDLKGWMNLSTNTASSVQTLDSKCRFSLTQPSGLFGRAKQCANIALMISQLLASNRHVQQPLSTHPTCPMTSDAKREFGVIVGYTCAYYVHNNNIGKTTTKDRLRY